MEIIIRKAIRRMKDKKAAERFGWEVEKYKQQEENKDEQ